jgi:hypothetical protein
MKTLPKRPMCVTPDKKTMYTVDRVYSKSEKHYGSVHGSEDGNITICGKEIEENGTWFIVNNVFTGKITCKKCLKKIDEFLKELKEMKINKIHKTPWAKEFKKEDPSIYDEAIEYASDKSITFYIYQSDETGKKVWSINHKGFWMNAFKTQKEAVELCKTMRWKYKIMRKS